MEDMTLGGEGGGFLQALQAVDQAPESNVTRRDEHGFRQGRMRKPELWQLWPLIIQSEKQLRALTP